MKLHCEHEIPLSADVFWEFMISPAYEAAVAHSVGLQAYQELERREDAAHLYRKLRVEAELPDSVRSIVRRIVSDETISYTEEQWRDRNRHEMRWKMTPSVLAHRGRVEGVVRVEPRGPERCVRILEGVVEVKILVVGGLLERQVVSMVNEAYGTSARIAAREHAKAGGTRDIA